MSGGSDDGRDVFWPGARRAGQLYSAEAFVQAMHRVETAWLRVLHRSGVAAEADPELVAAATVGVPTDVEASGNPLIPYLRALRTQLPQATAHWLHRGLTSQDVVDTAHVLCAGDALDQIQRELARAVSVLCRLADEHRGTLRAGRTLTQHAVPITFGLTVATWLDGLLDALDDVAAVSLPLQVGGAAGTLAATVAITGDPARALDAARSLATELGLQYAGPWHVNRRPIVRVGQALIGCVEACAHVANDVALASRPELAELAEAAPGRSSTMPHKRNPVLCVLIRRAGITAPHLLATLHAAAAAAIDQRPDGAWHAEWAALRELALVAVVAASQTAEVLVGLVVDADRMRATAQAGADDLLAEQRALTGRAAALQEYLGANAALVDAAVARGQRWLQRNAP